GLHDDARLVIAQYTVHAIHRGKADTAEASRRIAPGAVVQKRVDVAQLRHIIVHKADTYPAAQLRLAFDPEPSVIALVGAGDVDPQRAAGLHVAADVEIAAGRQLERAAGHAQVRDRLGASDPQGAARHADHPGALEARGAERVLTAAEV